MTPVRPESEAPRSRVKHSTIEPLRSLFQACVNPVMLVGQISVPNKNTVMFLQEHNKSFMGSLHSMNFYFSVTQEKQYHFIMLMKTAWTQILMKPDDLDLHCFQKV